MNLDLPKRLTIWNGGNMHQTIKGWLDLRYFQYSDIGLCCGHRSIIHKLCTDLNFTPHTFSFCKDNLVSAAPVSSVWVPYMLSVLLWCSERESTSRLIVKISVVEVNLVSFRHADLCLRTAFSFVWVCCTCSAKILKLFSYMMAARNSWCFCTEKKS
jgi:hypothetical protein